MTIYATDALEQIEHVDDLPLFNSDSADGVILEHSAVTPAMEAAIACHHLPCVYINPAHACTHNAVLIDDVAVARTATQQLIEAGHRQIAYLPATTGLHGSQADRRKGYVLAMTAAGLAPLPGWELDLPADFTNGLEIGRRVRQWRQRNATAVVTYNTATMVPLLWTAANLSLRLPQELSVVCCGCDAIINMFPFTIAHVFINQVEMGRRAVRMLKERVDRLGADVPAETVPFHFTAGASLCPARTP
jgi:LacI family sucrose operon transcriptional repressor